MVAPVKSPDELTMAFREQGLRVTPQRQAIFRILHGSKRHPTAEWVHEAARVDMPTISLKTVYQTLNDLAAMGELQQLHLGRGSARFDPTDTPHHHLVCESCGAVVDLHADFTDLQVPDGLGHGFLVSSTEIVFRGRCAECTPTQVGAGVVADASSNT
jgi:Fe2+ or Zn2+ uptake regulation protein